MDARIDCGYNEISKILPRFMSYLQEIESSLGFVVGDSIVMRLVLPPLW